MTLKGGKQEETTLKKRERVQAALDGQRRIGRRFNERKANHTSLSKRGMVGKSQTFRADNAEGQENKHRSIKGSAKEKGRSKIQAQRNDTLREKGCARERVTGKNFDLTHLLQDKRASTDSRVEGSPREVRQVTTLLLTNSCRGADIKRDLASSRGESGEQESGLTLLDDRLFTSDLSPRGRTGGDPSKVDICYWSDGGHSRKAEGEDESTFRSLTPPKSPRSEHEEFAVELRRMNSIRRNDNLRVQGGSKEANRQRGGRTLG